MKMTIRQVMIVIQRLVADFNNNNVYLAIALVHTYIVQTYILMDLQILNLY